MPTDLNLANDFFSKQQVPVSQNIQRKSAELARRANFVSYQSIPEYIGGIGGFGEDERYDYGIASNQLPALNRIRADIQPWTTQAGAFLNQAVVGEFIGGTIMSLGAIVGAPEMIANKLEGSEEDFHNTIFDIGKSISDWTQEKTPIYQTGERFSDSGWWFQNMVSVASAASIMAPGIGVAKGLGALTKAVKLSTIASDIVRTVGGSLAMRHAENFREASELYDNLYKTGIEKLNNGEIEGTEETVRKAASEGAALDYAANYANLAFDMIQLGAVLKPFKGLTRNVGKPAYAVARAEGMLPESRLGKVGYWLSSTGKDQLLPQLFEGLEEGINQISQYEGERKGRIEMGIEKDDNTTLGDRIGEYLGRPETIDAMMWGAVGGLAFKGAAMATGFDESNSQINKKLGELASRQATLQSYNKFIDAAVNNRQVTNDDGDIIADFTNVTEAEKSDIIDDLQNKMGFNLGFNAAKAGNVDLLLRQIESQEFKNDMIESGQATQEDVAQKIGKLKDLIIKGEELYQKHYTRLFNNPLDAKVKDRIINEAVNNDFKREQNLKRVKDLESSYIKLYNEDPMVQMFKGDPIFDNTIKQFGYIIAENTIQSQLKEYENTNKDGVHDKDIGHLNKILKIIQENKQKLGKTELINPKVIDSRLINNFAEQEILKADTLILSDKIANDESKENIEAKENEIKEIKESVKQNISENKINAEKEAKAQRLAQEKLEQDLDKLAAKISNGDETTQYSPEELQLQQNYPNEIELKLKTIESQSMTPEERFLNKSFDRTIATMSDEMFMDSFEKLINDSDAVIQNGRNYLNNTPNLSQDEKSAIGDIMRREVRKKRILNKKLVEVSERLGKKEMLQLPEKSLKTLELEAEYKRGQIEEVFMKIPVLVSEDGRSFDIRGKIYHNMFPNPEMAINRNNNGDIISVTLTDEFNRNETFTDEDIVDGIAYEILLSTFIPNISTDEIQVQNEEVNEVVKKSEDVSKKEAEQSDLFKLHRMLDEAISALDDIEKTAKQMISEYKELGFSENDINSDSDIVNLRNQHKDIKTAIKKIKAKISSIKGGKSVNITKVKEANEKSRTKRKVTSTEPTRIINRKEPKGKTKPSPAVQGQAGGGIQQSVQQKQEFIDNKQLVVSEQDKHLDNQIKTEEQTKVVADDEFIDSDVISKIKEESVKLSQDLKNNNGSKTLNNDGTISYNNSKITDGHNSLAHQDREYKRIKDGYEVSYEDVNDKLNDNAPIELLSGEIKVGDKVEFVVSDKDDITIYDPDSTQKEPITWGVYKKRLSDNNPGKDITKLSDYINNVPIQLKYKIINSYLHNTSWINEENVTGDIESDRIKLRDIRLKIVKDGKYTTSVSSISNGVLFTLSEGKTHSLKEAVGEDINFKLAVGFKDGTLKIGDKKVFQEGVVNENITSGVSYIISKLPNGKNIAIPVSNPKIGNIESKDIIKTNILAAIKAYLEQDKEVADNIRKVSGLEVRDIDGLETFIKMFIGMYNTNGQFLREMISSIPSGSNNAYFTIHHNTIEFFTGNLNNGGGKVYSISIDTKDKILPTQNRLQDLFLDKLSKAIDDFYLNNSIESVDKNRNIPIFDGDKVELKPYKDLIMENFTTDVKGNRVGEVNGVPVYSYVIQPVYRFDFNDILAEQSSASVSVEPVTSPSGEGVVDITIKSKLSAKERLAMRKLGIAANTVINKDNIKDSHKSC